MLRVCQLSPAVALSCLSLGRIEAAKKVYRLRKYGFDPGGSENLFKLLECTSFIDKVRVVTKCKNSRASIDAATDDFCRLSEQLRNEIAHPSSEEQSSALLSRDKLMPFIDWGYKLDQQLKEFLKSHNALTT